VYRAYRRSPCHEADQLLAAHGILDTREATPTLCLAGVQEVSSLAFRRICCEPKVAEDEAGDALFPFLQQLPWHHSDLRRKRHLSRNHRHRHLVDHLVRRTGLPQPCQLPCDG